MFTNNNIYIIFMIFSLVVRKLKEKIKDLNDRKTNFEVNQVIYQEMKRGIATRASKIKDVKLLTSREVRRVFIENIRDCQLKGDLKIE